MPTSSVSVVAAKIERVIMQSPGFGPCAEFLRDGGWFCCRAWIQQDGKPMVQARMRAMTPEQAAIVAVAINMALEWIAGVAPDPATERKEPRT